MDSKTFFLTYPQSSFQFDDLYEFYNSIKPVEWARISREKHEDGSDHHHAIIRFTTRVKTRSNLTLFDFRGRHPNIQCPRNIKHVLEYVAKDRDYQDFGQIPTADSVYDNLVQFAKAHDRNSFDKTALAGRISYMWAEHLWKRHSGSLQTIREPNQGTECLQLQTMSFDGGSLVLVGPSGCGKTTWASRVAPKPALLVTHMDDLKKLTDEHKSIIFDDMDFQHLPRTSQIHLVDQDMPRSIHCRNTIATIPKNTPKIFTANSHPFLDDEAINRRIIRKRIVL